VPTELDRSKSDFADEGDFIRCPGCSLKLYNSGDGLKCHRCGEPIEMEDE
jgi:DNA-directed RNA polymerase subunit RPC12/RpoP